MLGKPGTDTRAPPAHTGSPICGNDLKTHVSLKESGIRIALTVQSILQIAQYGKITQ